MLFFGVCFFLYFIKLSAGNGFFRAFLPDFAFWKNSLKVLKVCSHKIINIVRNEMMINLK